MTATAPPAGRNVSRGATARADTIDAQAPGGRNRLERSRFRIEVVARRRSDVPRPFLCAAHKAANSGRGLRVRTIPEYRDHWSRLCGSARYARITPKILPRPDSRRNSRLHKLLRQKTPAEPYAHYARRRHASIRAAPGGRGYACLIEHFLRADLRAANACLSSTCDKQHPIAVMQIMHVNPTASRLQPLAACRKRKQIVNDRRSSCHERFYIVNNYMQASRRSPEGAQR